MTSIPVKLLRPVRPQTGPTFDVSPDTQCIFQIFVPLGLPRLLNSSLPPPPYYGDRPLTEYRIAARPIVRAILSGLLYEMLGHEQHSQVSSIMRSEDDISLNPKLWRGWDGKITKNKNDFDLATGWWKDQYGEEGHGIDAYLEYSHDPDHVEIIKWFEFLVLHGEKPEGDQEHRVIQFEAKDELDDGKVLFRAREYSEARRVYVNDRVKR